MGALKEKMRVPEFNPVYGLRVRKFGEVSVTPITVPCLRLPATLGPGKIPWQIPTVWYDR